MHLGAMKTVVLWAFLLGAVRCGDYSEMFKCAADPRNINLKIYRNQTCHWKAQVQLEHTDVEGDVAAWNVDSDQTFTPRCDGIGSVLVVVTITVPPQGIATVKPQTPKRIPEGYLKFSENHYFKIHTEHAIWAEALGICEKEGAHLAVINSQAEAKFVASIWNLKAFFVFIGFHDLYGEGKFLTIYNQTLREAGYEKWHPKDPNGRNGEDCGLITKTMLLGDQFCNEPTPFLCELEY